MSDKIRKYVLPNLPYLFVFWFFSKIGTAYRIAPGTDFGTKLMGMLDTFPKAFETYWPGLGGIDLLVGLAGAAGMYLLIQSKIRQAKKFRRDAEYGTARFGTKEDIKPFVDPKFQNNVILTGTEFLTMNTRPKIPANARNLNACVIGSSGSGKTRFWLTPQLLQAHSSYVVVDPKGGTLDQCGRFLQREKYRVRVFNSIDFSKSMHYNPLAYIKTESDVLKFVTALIANTKGDGKEGDEFWTKAETLLYCALVSYIVFEGPEEERNMNTLVEMINSMEVREDDETFKNAVDYMFDGLERRSPQHFAVRQYKKYKLASGKTAKSILISCGARLAPFDIPQLREIMSYDELELDKLGDEKSALFFLISDTAGNGAGPVSAENMLAVVCADADGAEDILSWLDGVFSAADAGEALAPDAAYCRIEKPVKETVSLAGEGTGGVYFGIVCPRAGEWTRVRLAALAAALERTGSLLDKSVCAALPDTETVCGTASAGADAAIWFFAPGLEEKDAEVFRDAVLAVLRSAAGGGFSDPAVETLSAAQRLEELTFPERDDLGAALCEGFAAAWAQGDASGYPAQLRARWNAAAYLADGSCAEAVREELLESTRTALVTVVPEPAREPEPTPEAIPEPTEEAAPT